MKIALCKITWLGNMSHGWGNGYVVLDKGSKYDGADYNDIPIEAHGGLTFSGRVRAEDLDKFEGLDASDVGKWMVGFDTAHFGDDQARWTKENVRKETIELMKRFEEAI